MENDLISRGAVLKLIKELRKYCIELNKYGGDFNNRLSCEIHNAIDTIESLSAKLQEGNHGDGWIPCNKRLPEEKINLITKDFCEYQVTFKSEDAKDIRHYKFGRGHWWNGPEIMDEYVTAWREKIEPYHEP